MYGEGGGYLIMYGLCIIVFVEAFTVMINKSQLCALVCWGHYCIGGLCAVPHSSCLVTNVYTLYFLYGQLRQDKTRQDSNWSACHNMLMTTHHIHTHPCVRISPR